MIHSKIQEISWNFLRKDFLERNLTITKNQRNKNIVILQEKFVLLRRRSTIIVFSRYFKVGFKKRKKVTVTDEMLDGIAQQANEIFIVG